MEPLLIYESRTLKTITSKDGEVFTIILGLSKVLIEQLKAYSLDVSDTDLQANTSDRQRFGEGSYEEWYGKDRTPYALVDHAGKLAALAWFGPKPLGRKSLRYLSAEERAQELQQQTGEWHTIVYRSYNPYRGRGLMTPFMRYVIADYKKRYPHARLWAGISTKNEASIGLAKRFGFIESVEHSDPKAKWCAMIEQ